MQIRIATVILATVAILTTGCAADDQARMITLNTKKKVQALETQVQGMENILRSVPVALEPTQDVSEGTYMGRIERISSDSATPVFLIDFVTPELVPWATDEQRRLSSWPDLFGWNKTKHPEQFPVSEYAVLVERRTPPSKFVLGIVSLEDFERYWARYKERVHFIIINDGKVDAVWPWVP